jgi:hypothetical protein
MADIPPVQFDPRQTKINEQLERLGPAPAAYFRDVCRLFQDLARLEASGNVAGHLLRELKGSVKDVLYPEEEKNQKDADRRAIIAIAEAYGLPPDHEIIELWPNLRLEKLAHRDELGSPRQLAEVQKAWGDLQIVLSVLLDALDGAYTKVYERLDQLLAKQQPDKDDIKQLLAKIPNNNHTLRYFFAKVQGRRWFELLRDSTMFDSPSAGYWPQAEYLRRIAVEFPDEVTPILEKAAATWSYYTHHQILEAIRSFSPAAAGRILRISARSVMTASGHDTFLAGEIAKRVAAIANDDPDAALDVFATLLALQPEAPDPKGGYLGVRELGSPLEFYTYSELVGEPLHAVIALAPQQSFDQLLALIDNALGAIYAATKPDDFSKGWMPAIEPHEQNTYHYEPLPRLAEGLRDAAETLVKSNSSALQSVIEKLDARNWHVLQRLALHLLTAFGDPAEPFLQARVLDERFFFERDLRHEFGALLKKTYPALPDADKARVLGWIKGGPKIMPKEYTPDDERYLRESWALQRLSWLRDFLNVADRATLAELEGAHGVAEEASEFSGYMSGPYSGPRSAKTEDELRDMLIPDLVTFLRDWQPSGERSFGGFAPTREGVARTLQPVVKARAIEFAASAESFIGLDATFVRTVIAGFEDAVKEHVVIDWQPVLRLCRWAVEQSRVIPGRDRKGFDNDPDWGWAWAAIARLLRTAFGANEDAQIPLALRDEVWKILRPITDDPDPDPSRETEERDPYSTAINSTRGVAMEALVDYALMWVRRRHYLPEGAAAFEDMPEVEEVLTRHLDPAVDPSRAIRAVYGEALYRLCRMNRAWVESHVTALFPADHPELADAVLHTYLAWGRVMTPELNALITPQLARAIESFPGTTNDGEKVPAYVGLVAHRLMAMYLYGEIDTAPGSLLAEVFARADEKTRAHVILNVPRIIDQAADDEKAVMTSRAVAFWEWRVATSTDTDLRGFGSWMQTEVFDRAWRLAHLATVLERAATVDMDFQVVETLADLAREYPGEALRCARLLVGTRIDGMRLHGLMYRGRLQRIIRAALRSGDPSVEKDARSLGNVLVARGFDQFRDVLDLTKPDPDEPDGDE